MNEQLQRQPQRMTFSQYVNSATGKALIANAIKSPAKREAFITAIVSAVATNPGLQECTAPSIISAALQGAALGLAPSPQLGQFYMVPFKQKEKKDRNGNVIQPECMIATFIPGYKGYIQLAWNSEKYVDIDAGPVLEGEYKGRDRFTGRPAFEWVEDYAQAEQLPVVGYMARFELVNGAKKVIYWPKEKMISHADRHSPAFSREATAGQHPKVSFADYEAGNYPKNDEWKYSSFWYKDFDSMAQKTMLRQLITKWGPMSAEMESAVLQDMQAEADGVDYDAGFADAAIPDAPVLDVEIMGESTKRPGDEEQVGLDDL